MIQNCYLPSQVPISEFLWISTRKFFFIFIFSLCLLARPNNKHDGTAKYKFYIEWSFMKQTKQQQDFKIIQIMETFAGDIQIFQLCNPLALINPASTTNSFKYARDCTQLEKSQKTAQFYFFIWLSCIQKEFK